MRAHPNFINTVFHLILLAALVGGCTIIYPPSTLYLVPTASGTNAILPSLIRTPSLTLSKTEIPTLTVSMTPSLTLVPTPLGVDAKSKVAYLLETNGNCSLPCWWGITPGQTTWSEAEPYLAAFALEISQPSSPKPKNLTYYPSEFPDPNSKSPDDYLIAGFAVNNSGVVEIIDSIAKTSLASMLTNTGVPSQIWIEITTNFGPGPMSYILALFYDKGIMAVYQGTISSGDINFINICPRDIPRANSQLLVWNNATIRTFEDIGVFDMLLDPNHLRFRLIQEVSDMQPQSFFDLYINPSEMQCIKTPLSDC